MTLKVEISDELFTVAQTLLKAKDAFNKEIAKLPVNDFEVEVEEFNLSIAALLRTVVNFSTLKIHEDYFKKLGYDELTEMLG